MKRDKFAGRYLIKISSSAFIIILNVIVNFILPRAFSVEEYGFYTFNLNVFNNIVGIANLSASNALSAKYSKRNDEIGIIRFYLFFFALMTVGLSVGLIVLYPFEFIRNSLGGQTLLIVLLGLEASVLNKLLTDTITIYDSIAVSRFPAFLQIILKICMAAFVVSTFFLGRLNIFTYYIGQFIIFFTVIFILLKSFFKDHKLNYKKYKDLGFRHYLMEFYEYCKPLIFVGIFSQVLNIFMDVTLLQNSGATVRAMYGAATQLNMIIVYVFSPYAELSKREFAVRVGDDAQVKTHLIQSAKIVMWMTSYFSIFVALFADKIVPFVFGEKYQAAIPVVIFMMIYTIYQSWGQVLSSYLLSTEQTKVHAVFSVISQLCLLLGFLVFLKPNFIWNNGLGAEGMALARAVANFVYVVIMAGWIAKDIGYSAVKMNAIHFLAIMITGAFAIISRFIIGIVSACIFSFDNLFFIIISGVLYTIFMIIIVYNFPKLIGVSKVQIMNIISSVKHHKVSDNAK